MASDPSALIMQLLNGGANIGAAATQGQQQGVQNVLGAQQAQAGALQLQAVQQQRQQAQAYQQDVEGYFKDPTPQNLAALAVKYPQQADSLKQSYSIMSAPMKESRIGVLGNIYNAAKNGRADLVAKQMDNVIQAEKAAGIDTSDAEDVKSAIAGGDKDALTRAQAFAQLHLAAADADFAKAIGVTGDKADDSVVVNAGGALVRKGTGEVLYAANEKPEYRTIKNADGSESIIAVGGDRPLGGNGPASSGTIAPGQRYTGGWTPRAANGGDNSDVAVDNKIAGVAGALGVDPNADISKMPPMQIAQALSYGEGGKGTLADRNNNPSNIRNADGSYRSFGSTDQAMNAAAALVARKLKNGQTTVRSLIEGLPVGGATATSGTLSPTQAAKVLFTSQSADGANAPGDATKTGDEYLKSLDPATGATVKALAEGRMALPTGAALRSPKVQALIAATAQYDPQFSAANAPARVATYKSFTSGKNGQTVTAINTLINHLVALKRASDDLSGVDLKWNPLTTAVNTSAQAFQGPELKRYNAILPLVADELEKVARGSSGSVSGIKAAEQALAPNTSKANREAALDSVLDVIQGRLGPLAEQYNRGMQTDKDPMELLSPQSAKELASLRRGSSDQQPEQSGSPVRVTSRAQALALAPGTKFIDPTGTLRVRP